MSLAKDTISIIDRVFDLKLIYTLMTLLLSIDTYLVFFENESLFSITSLEINFSIVVKALMIGLILTWLLVIFMPMIRIGINVSINNILRRFSKEKIEEIEYYSLDELRKISIQEQNQILYQEYIRCKQNYEQSSRIRDMIYTIGFLLIFRTFYDMNFNDWPFFMGVAIVLIFSFEGDEKLEDITGIEKGDITV